MVKRVSYITLALVLVLTLTSCSTGTKGGDADGIDFLPVIEDVEVTPPPFSTTTLDISLSTACYLADAVAYQTVDEYLVANPSSEFKVYELVLETPYDGVFYLSSFGSSVFGMYSTISNPDIDKLSTYLGIELSEADLSNLSTQENPHYEINGGEAFIDYTQRGWCFVRALDNPNYNSEVVS